MMPVLTGYVLDFEKKQAMDVLDLVDDSLSEDSLSEEELSEEEDSSSQGQIAEKIFFDIPQQNKAKLVVQNREKVGSFKSTNKPGMKVSSMNLENIIEVVGEDGSPCVIKQSSAINDIKELPQFALQLSVESPDSKNQVTRNADIA